MALFKIFRGRKANLPSQKTDGYAYFTTDDGKFYIDAQGQGESSPVRTCINPTMTGATSSLGGEEGLVPASSPGDQEKYLRADGSWSTPQGGGGGGATYDSMTQIEANTGTSTADRVISPKVLAGAIQYHTQALGTYAYTTTVGNNNTSSFSITHNLNTKHIIVSVNIIDDNIEYIAPLTGLNNSSQIGYTVTISNENTIIINFSSAPATNGAVINIISTIAHHIDSGVTDVLIKVS